MIKWETINYPSSFVTLADELAHLRTFHSKHVYKQGTEKYRGNQEHAISVLGILCELIARNYFEESNNTIRVAPLITDNPVVGADIILEGFGEEYLIDVKGLKSSSEFLRVNFKAHNNPNKKITHYFFVQPLTKKQAKFCWVKFDAVNNWEVLDSTYTKIYSHEIT
tara:strand:- start:8437 stop:8934 length:498 start_codon:yes stop_codon:yes gene_type:complete